MGKIILEWKDLGFLGKICYPDIKINQGEFVVIQGESGSGKSSLLRLLNQTVSQTRGTIYLDGRDLNELDALEIRRKIILAAQNVFVFPGSIQDNFKIYYERVKRELPNKERIRECLDICQVKFDEDSICDMMSGGEKQRVFLAIAISFSPEILLLDEPTSALDPDTAKKLIERIFDDAKKSERTVLMVSHDKALADFFADKQIVLEGGGHTCRE